MSSFIGEFPCKVDPKGRIMLPSALKRQMPSDAKDTFVIKKDIYSKCLVIYPLNEWERQNEILRSKINPYNKEHALFMREFHRGTAEVELDNTNRMLIPKRLLDIVEIKSDVVLAGIDSKIELWAKEIYDQNAQNEDDFAALASKILGS